MFAALDEYTLALVDKLPLEWFALIGSFIEEVVAPVPAVAVLLTTGSVAALQDRSLLDLIPLIALATAGKTVGAIIVYGLSYKVGHAVVDRFGGMFNIKAQDLENFGSKLTGGPRDYFLLTLIRAAPIIPSSVVSIGGGLLKIPFKVYIVATVLGTIVRDGFFLYVGYSGTTFLHSLASSTDNLESTIQNGLIFTALVGMVYLLYKKRQQAKARTD